MTFDRAVRNREIFERREDGETLEVIARDYGITDERVRQIHHLERRRPHRVELTFRDRDDVPWRVYEFAYVGGRAVRHPIGTLDGIYRGFERLEGSRELWAKLIAKKDDVAKARILSATELQRELDESTVWPPVGTPAVPKTRRELALSAADSAQAPPARPRSPSP